MLLAMERLKKNFRKIQNLEPKNYKDWYYLKADISGFFMHINKKILNDLILQKILSSPFSEKIKEELRWLAETIIFHNPTENYFLKGDKNLLKTVPRQKSLFRVPDGIGLPIGNRLFCKILARLPEAKNCEKIQKQIIGF